VGSRLAAVVALLLLVFCASSSARTGTPSRGGAFPGRNGEILFSRLRVANGDSGLYVMRPDGTHQRRITSTPGFEAGAKWSPDGARILYTKDPQTLCPKPQLFVMQADGTRLRRITRDRGCYSNPAWSPDGRRIVFTRCSGRCTQFSLWTLNVNGSGLRRLTHGTLDLSPAWSPDGTTIAFVRGYPDAIWLMDADGSNQRQLTTPPPGNDENEPETDTQPNWSPDGASIAFSREHEPHMGTTGNTAYRQDIYLIRADGTGLRRLTRLSASNISPAWSPDGKRIVFASSRAHAGERGGEQVMDIYVMNANGTQPKRLTRTPLFPGSPDWRPRL
jgi:TolB protein